MHIDYRELAECVMKGRAIGREGATALLESPDDDLLALLDGAYSLRCACYGRDVKLHVLRNARVGGCTEDCAFCSQSAVASASDVPRAPMASLSAIVEAAYGACERRAARYCIVTTGRRPGDDVMDAVCGAVERIRRERLPLSICVSLGALDEGQAERLKGAGVDRVNHNLEASPAAFARLCTSHPHEERVATARIVKAAGLELCSGGLVGAGETLAERAELAVMLREVGSDAVPINFFDPRPGTPLAYAARISANDALRALAMFRFVLPCAEIRMAGGREKALGPLQALGLYAADSMFTEGYLTTGGQGFDADAAMIAAAGFEIAGTLE